MNSEAIVVLTTVPNAEAAERMARIIVEAKLAACVQVLLTMQSVYVWKDEVQTESENLLLIKTLRDKYDELERLIRANHSYDVPEIMALQAERISETYLGWLRDSLA